MFLIIDYEQGCGGERLCADLSNFAPCVKLNSTKINTQTKVDDIFANEFLKPNPDISKINIPQIKTKDIQIIPTHRHTDLLEKILKNTISVRIKWPSDFYFVKKAVAKQLDKYYFNQVKDPMRLAGHVRMIMQQHNVKQPLKIQGNKFIIDYEMEAKNLELTTANKLDFIKNTFLENKDEPDCHYDYVIPYEHFYNNQKSVLDTFKKIGINATKKIFIPYV